MFITDNKRRYVLRIRAPAGVTVYAILILTVVSSLIFALIRSAIFSSTMARIDSACSLASESAFAGYSNKVFDDYGIFVLKNNGSAAARMNEVLRANMNGSAAVLTNTYITNQVFMTDNGGEPFYKEAVDYMQNEAVTDYLSSLTGELSESKSVSGLENLGKISEKASSLGDENLSDDELRSRFSSLEADIDSCLGESDVHGNFLEFIKDDMGNGKDVWDEMERRKAEEGVTYVEPESDKDLLAGFKNIQRFLKGDLTGLVLGGSPVSGRSVTYPEGTKNEDITGRSYDGDGVAENVAFTEFLFLKFKSYTDINESDIRGSNPGYELEYIAGGKASDRDNLNYVMKRLALIRQGLNMLHIMSDPEKRGESDAMAVLMLGWTLNPLLVKGGSYAIMAAWSYAEAIADLKLLYSGKKVPIFKTAATWSLSLENMLTGSLGPGEDKGHTGLGYEMYLRSLLELMPVSVKCGRAMDVIDMRMADAGDTDFRMRNCIFSQSLFASFTLPYTFLPYEREYEYAYSVR